MLVNNFKMCFHLIFLLVDSILNKTKEGNGCINAKCTNIDSPLDNQFIVKTKQIWMCFS